MKYSLFTKFAMAGQSQYPYILSDFSEDELVTNQYTIHTTNHTSSILHMSYCFQFQQKIQESRIEKPVKEYG